MAEAGSRGAVDPLEADLRHRLGQLLEREALPVAVAHIPAAMPGEYPAHLGLHNLTGGVDEAVAEAMEHLARIDRPLGRIAQEPEPAR
jgi:hypothetical protein